MSASHPSPLAALFALVAEDASGEFVCVSSTCELHVYLQGGRIAWATDSTLPFAFSRHLLENTALTKETFNEVLEACRRDRLPLGETLIEWQVATLDEIRAALEHQIRGALTSLRQCTKERTIFLERQRQFASYDARLTFDAHQLVLAPTPVPPDPGVVSSVGPSGLVLERIRSQLPDTAWLELLDGDVVIEQLPPGFAPLVPAGILEHSVLDGADLVAVRTGRGTVLGVALPERRKTLWCRLEVETAFGTTLSALCQHARIVQHTTPVPPAVDGWGKPAPVRGIGDGDRAPGSVEMRNFMDRAPEIDGVLLVENDQPVCGAVRRHIDAEWMKGIVRRRAPVLEVLLAEAPDTTADLEELGYRLKSVVTGEDQVWCFGAELESEPRRTLWIFTDRQSAQGLGWAYLTSLSRQLSSSLRPEHVKAE